jgi:hypothetical protein
MDVQKVQPGGRSSNVSYSYKIKYLFVGLTGYLCVLGGVDPGLAVLVNILLCMVIFVLGRCVFIVVVHMRMRSASARRHDDFYKASKQLSGTCIALFIWILDKNK